jgi:protein-S-isoprenylcysteine O-methyltransferase Ste14
MLWSQPAPTSDRLLLNLLWSGWICVGTTLEERDLVAEFGEVYRQYQQRGAVPSDHG